MSDPYVRQYLEIYAILAFDLLEDEDLPIDSPILMRVDLAVEPSDIRQFPAIMKSKLDSSKKIEGMLQVNEILKITEDSVLSQRAMRSWRENVVKQRESTRLFLFDFARSGYSYSWTYCLRLSESAWDLAGLGFYDNISTVDGDCEMPMNEPNTIEYVLFMCGPLLTCPYRYSFKCTSVFAE